ncbi:hypothetical protein B9Z55_026483 [Caenorhabditis nigoni]|uniref:Uncharacterized protein n=1 Tax=Caenorhabditis nigoni TaxID=1611254 RepID=A0A2G5T3M7_9PELO|nr:hypothetical protein B9Z55_026483 [Caenorhabditis nigoni]
MSSDSFPSPSTLRRRRAPARVPIGTIHVATICLEAFQHVEEHEFATIVFTHQQMMATIGRFVGGVGQMIFLSLAGDTEEQGVLLFAGQRFFHVKHGSNHFFMEVASEEQGGQLKTLMELKVQIEDVESQ